MFNIRVYGIHINAKSQVLVTDEYRYGREITKFPGGGLEFGEGTIECLKREAVEELGQEIKILRHFYTTDFFQVSAFDAKQQIVSIYYLMAPVESFRAPVTKIKFDFKKLKEGVQTFRWIKLEELSEEDLTFPIDKKVARLILDHKELNNQKNNN